MIILKNPVSREMQLLRNRSSMHWNIKSFLFVLMLGTLQSLAPVLADNSTTLIIDDEKLFSTNIPCLSNTSPDESLLESPVDGKVHSIQDHGDGLQFLILEAELNYYFPEKENVSYCRLKNYPDQNFQIILNHKLF